MKHSILISMSALALTACVQVPVAAPAGALQPEAGFQVQLNQAWTHYPETSNPVTQGSFVTLDGPILNRVHMMTISDGEAIMKASKRDDVPRYTVGMSQIEMVELLTSSLNRVGYSSIEADNIAPADFDGSEGIRFNVTGKYDTGLNLKGDVAVAEIDNQLHIIFFLAPELHYYDATTADVDALINSANFN